MRLYNEEKVLYFAERPEALHVSDDEPIDSDLSRLVREALNRGHIRLVEAGKAGEFFEATTAGKIRLLELQIEWRLRRGKSTAGHRQRLEELKTEENRHD